MVGFNLNAGGACSIKQAQKGGLNMINEYFDEIGFRECSLEEAERALEFTEKKLKRMTNMKKRFEWEKCPGCGRIVKNWEVTIGTFGNEKWFQDRMKKENIDSKTGHKIGCQFSKK